MRRPWAALVLVGCVAAGVSACAGGDEGAVRAVVEEFAALSRDDDAAALALTDAPASTLSCLADLGGLRGAEIDATTITGDEAEVRLRMPVDGESRAVELTLARHGDTWRIVVDDALSMTVSLEPEGMPMDLSVGARCVLPHVEGTAIIAAPPGGYRVSASDAEGVVFTADVEGLSQDVVLPGAAQALLDVDAARPSTATLRAIDLAVGDVLAQCTNSDFRGFACPPSVQGATSQGGRVEGLPDVNLHATTDGWEFVSAPMPWLVGFEGDEDWRTIDVVVSGVLTGSETRGIGATIVEVRDAT